MPFAFKPMGPTVAISAASTAPTAVQVPISTAFGSGPAEVDFRVINAGTANARLAVDVTAAAAAADATSDTRSTMLLPGSVEILRFPRDSFFTAQAATAGTVYIQPGDGI